jgi:hypothetical protein
MGTATLNLKTLTASLAVLLAAGSICVGKGWRGIVPLHSSCEDVKRVLNVSECRSFYDTEEGKVYIGFSKKPCADGWKVPPGTVLHISVYPKNAPLVEELGLDLRAFQKEISYDSPEYVFYTNKKIGMSLAVGPDQRVSCVSYFEEATDEYLRYPGSLAEQSTISTGDPQGTYKFDEYGDLPVVKEHERLNNLVQQFAKESEAEARIYIIVYAGRRAHVGEAAARAARVKDYLVKMRGLDKERIVTVDGGYREHLTIELFVRLKGGATPTASPTVCPGEVEIIAGCAVSR